MYPIASYGMVANVLGCKQEEGRAGDVRGRRRPDFVSFRERAFAAAGVNESAAVDGRRTHPAVEGFLVLLSAATVVGALFASHGVRKQSVGACGTGQPRTRRRGFTSTRGVTIQSRGSTSTSASAEWGSSVEPARRPRAASTAIAASPQPSRLRRPCPSRPCGSR